MSNFTQTMFELSPLGLEPAAEERFTISFELHKENLRPDASEERVNSGLCFEYPCVGLTPVPKCDSGDPQDHYLVPFPTKSKYG